MIVPMKKVCLMVQESRVNDALLKLREVGVVHLHTANAPDGNSKAIERKSKVEGALGLLGEIKVPKNKNALTPSQPDRARLISAGARRGRRSVDVYGSEEEEPYSLDAVITSGRPYLPDLIVGIGKERKALQDRDIFLNREISRISPWGDFEPSSIKEMESLGLPVFLYELTPEAFSAISEDVRYIKLFQNKNVVRLVVLDKEIQGIAPFQLPEKSMSALIRETDEIKLDIEELDAKLRNFVSRRSALISEMAVVEQDIEFETAVVNMEKVDGVPAEMGLSYLTGYVPCDDTGRLKTAASENGWALSLIDPEDTDEAVPTKLKNSKFVNLLNPITGFLGIVPGYRETDISPWFLIFFCIFFGMIFGDAAYGVILSLVALFGIIKTAKKGVPQALQMLLLLGIFNTAWGVITCTWFGVKAEKVPQVLQDISLPVFSTAKTDSALVSQNLQIFCFSLGLLQLTIAHIKGFFRNIRSLKLFSELGSIAMLFGMYNVVLFLVVSNDARSIPLLPVSIYLLGGGFVLNFIFASYEGSIGRSVLESCKNIISVVLGITNVFSDIMSYIRLWAVGLAGASIASTVNTMAGPLLGGFLMFAGMLLLVFGHGLNIILNVLSVLVHGVRLNTLEFSSHIGLTWSGTAYKPFAQRAIK
ncbi:MAG: V-type ATP synthase subunit I [Treponema sp.]|jgi:V/A-type H+-transporting ATPase subunit I|nr:V-type ATP synthase subunit I [Treponema sp.]